jgi:DNA polymerase-3 subunit epsilon
MLDWLRKTNWYQQRLISQTDNEQLADYLKTPLVDKQIPAIKAEYMALDFETTGLNPEADNILSAGYTMIRDGRVILGESGHFLVRINAPLPAHSVVIHQITDDAMEQGMALPEVMERLLDLMKGKVLLVHYAAIERGFLNAASKRLYGIKLPMRMVDTMEIEKGILQRREQGIAKGQLRLFNLRKQYNLPRYRAHNAMEDALSTAELFLAQMNYKKWEQSGVLLKDLLKPV